MDQPPSSQRRSVRELSRAECLNLLGEEDLGRIVFTSQALPVALPVNFVVDLAGAGGIVFRTAEGSKLSAATNGSVVAFEADHMDSATGEGWSVLVTGLAGEIGERAHRDRADALGLYRWGLLDSQSHYICIPISMVSGRRVTMSGNSRSGGNGHVRHSSSSPASLGPTG